MQVGFKILTFYINQLLSWVSGIELARRRHHKENKYQKLFDTIINKFSLFETKNFARTFSSNLRFFDISTPYPFFLEDIAIFLSNPVSPLHSRIGIFLITA